MEDQMTAYDYADFESPLPHPGESLREDFLPDYGLTAGSLAKAMGLKDRTRIERIIREKNPITADTALRLGRVFGTSAQMWINMQTAHDLSVAAIKAKDELAALKVLEPA
jgi:addiction module HigA family antidote